MAPHQCETLMKAILTDKTFNPNLFLRSGFGEFLTQILSYLAEFNKEQESGFFKRAKYADTKSLIKSLKVIFQAATAQNFKPEYVKQLDQIFCTLLHPMTPTCYRSDSIDLFFLMLSLIPEDNVQLLTNSFTVLVPHLTVAQKEDAILFNKLLYSKYQPIIDPQSIEPTVEEAAKALDSVLSFIYKNWTSRTQLCVSLLFNSILMVIYKGPMDKLLIDTCPYGFSQLPLTFHHSVIKFLLDLVNNEMNLKPLFATTDQIKTILCMLAQISAHVDLDEFITAFRLLQTIVASQPYFEMVVEADDKAITKILNIMADILTTDAGKKGQLDSPLLTVYYEFVNSFLTATLVRRTDLDSSLMIYSKVLAAHESDTVFIAYFSVCTFRWMIATNDRRPNLWSFFTREFTQSPILAASTSLFAQYLVARSLPCLFAVDKSESLQIAANFVTRNKRNRQESKYDFVAENLPTLLESPHDFVRLSTHQVWQGLEQYDSTMQNIYIQPLETHTGEDLVEEIVFFLSQFSFYPTLQFAPQREQAFAPIYTFSSMMAQLMLFPPGISFDSSAPFSICGNFLFTAIFNQSDMSIRFSAFEVLSKMLNLNEMKPYLGEKTLSQWYGALILMMCSTDLKIRTFAFAEAQNTLQHSFSGAPFLQNFMMTIIEEKLIPYDSSIFSFLSSFPLFVTNAKLPADFIKSIYEIIKKKPDSFIQHPEQKIEKGQTSLRERSICVLKEMHEKRFLEIDGSPTWDLLIPTYSALIADELTQAKPDINLMTTFLRFFIDAIKNHRTEAIMAIRSCLMYKNALIAMMPKELSEFVSSLTERVVNILPAEDPKWAFQMIRLLSDVYVVTSPVMKTGPAYTSFVKFLYEGFTKKVKEGYASEVQGLMKNTLDILSKQYCRYPCPHTAQFMTNTTSRPENKENTQFFTLGHTILATSINNDTVTMSTQFPSGQFIWNFTPLQEKMLIEKKGQKIQGTVDKKVQNSVSPTFSTPKQGKFATQIDDICNSYQSQFKDNFTFDEIPEDDSFLQILDNVNSEIGLFIDQQPDDLTAIYPTPPLKPVNPVACALLATGRLRMDHIEKLQQINTEGRALDVIEKANSNSLRLGTKIGVVYVGQECTDQNQILSIQYEETSPHFHEFITGLGWPVDLQKHIGYLGGLDAKNTKNGRTSIYYADSMHEMMFHISPLIPNDPNDAQQIYKKRHIGNDHVHIVWCGGNKDYNTATITSQFNQAHIVIYPLQTALFRVDVFWRQELDWFGPLRHSIVINKRSLPSLVRETAESAMITFYQKQSAFAHPAADVQAHIKNLLSNFTLQPKQVYDPILAIMMQDTK